MQHIDLDANSQGPHGTERGRYMRRPRRRQNVFFVFWKKTHKCYAAPSSAMGRHPETRVDSDTYKLIYTHQPRERNRPHKPKARARTNPARVERNILDHLHITLTSDTGKKNAGRKNLNKTQVEQQQTNNKQ